MARLGVPLDYTKVVQWYEKAVAQGARWRSTISGCCMSMNRACRRTMCGRSG